MKKKNNLRINALASLLLLAASASVYGQQYKLQGKVTDEKKEAVSMAVVVLQVADSLVSTTLTDEKGNFEIRELTKGNYRLSLTAEDYQALDENIALTADKRVTYTLYPERKVELSGVEVVADRSNVVRQTANGAVFYLSAAAKDRLNPYEALLEIPKLIVNATDRKITMNDGSTPLILINGIKTGTGLNSVDPKDIESIEVVDFPPARYMRDGVTAVLNVKVKRKQYNYRSFNAYSKHSLPIKYGNTGLGYETGNARYSLSLSGSHFYFTDDKSEFTTEQSSSSYNKSSKYEYLYNMQSYYAALGGDYVVSDRDYLSYSITYTNSPTPPTTTSGSGILRQGENVSHFDMLSNQRTTYYLNTYNLFHKHSFEKNKSLETTFQFNLNGNRMSGDRHEFYDNLPDYNYEFNYNNYRLSSLLELSYNSSLWNQSLNLGSKTTFKKDKIEQLTMPVFNYGEWMEYLFGELSGSLSKKLFYSASLGVDLIFNNSQNISNHYVKFAPVASATYRFNPTHSLALSYGLYNSPPPISALNPYNTSTDSLFRQTGNPYLLPEQQHRFTINYTFNKNGIYLSPVFRYKIITDVIVESGSMDGNIYNRTYINDETNRELDGALNLRYNNQKFGSIGGAVGYRHSYFSNVDRGSFYTNVNLNLQYRKFSLSSYVSFQRNNYSRYSTTRRYAPESEITLGWRLNSNLSLNAGMRYYLGRLKSESVTENGEYRSESMQVHIDRSYLFMAGFSYYWRNKAQTPQRNRKQINNSEGGISL